MIKIEVSPIETYNANTNMFTMVPGGVLVLEHSLIAISKWEQITHKPFFSKGGKTYEETILYIKGMTLNNVDPTIYDNLTLDNMNAIQTYMEDSNTAIVFRAETRNANVEQMTFETIYYWMFSLGIPKECEKWHINKLLNLIKVINLKNKKPSEADRKSINARNKNIMAQRRAARKKRG